MTLVDCSRRDKGRSRRPFVCEASAGPGRRLVRAGVAVSDQPLAAATDLQGGHPSGWIKGEWPSVGGLDAVCGRWTGSETEALPSRKGGSTEAVQACSVCRGQVMGRASPVPPCRKFQGQVRAAVGTCHRRQTLANARGQRQASPGLVCSVRGRISRNSFGWGQRKRCSPLLRPRAGAYG